MTFVVVIVLYPGYKHLPDPGASIDDQLVAFFYLFFYEHTSIATRKVGARKGRVG